MTSTPLQDWPGYSVPDDSYTAPPVRSTSAVRLLVLVALVAALVAAGSAALSVWLTPPKALVICPPDCGSPPISKPVATNPRFTASGGEFSVSYPGEQTA
jgi:hypothetical protein